MHRNIYLPYQHSYMCTCIYTCTHTLDQLTNTTHLIAEHEQWLAPFLNQQLGDFEMPMLRGGVEAGDATLRPRTHPYPRSAPHAHTPQHAPPPLHPPEGHDWPNLHHGHVTIHSHVTGQNSVGVGKLGRFGLKTVKTTAKTGLIWP